MNLLLEIPISKIREKLLLMSGVTERNYMSAVKALNERDGNLADKVEADDNLIDELEMEIDEEVIAYMATRGPMATDCRLAMAASKISSNLERIGDEATTIARRSKLLNHEPQLQPPPDLASMSEIAVKMMHDSITAFIQFKPELALEIVERDEAVDKLNRQITGELTARMKENGANINRCINLMRVVKCIERIADHSANIAENVYYLHLGRDIRHGRIGREYDNLQQERSLEKLPTPPGS